jgi:hypothetical protein
VVWVMKMHRTWCLFCNFAYERLSWLSSRFQRLNTTHQLPRPHGGQTTYKRCNLVPVSSTIIGWPNGMSMSDVSAGRSPKKKRRIEAMYKPAHPHPTPMMCTFVVRLVRYGG